MKQLLLSTVILFGTLGSINAADAGEGGEAKGTTELAAVAAVPVGDYRADLRLAFDRLDANEYEWEKLGRIRRATLGSEDWTPDQCRALERRQARLEEAIIKCLDEMTHYIDRLYVRMF